MSFSVKLLVSLFACFSLTAIILPILIWFLRKEKIKQVILHYVDMHSYKSGTPTMGGIAFVLSICICGLIFCNGESTLSLMTIIVTFSYGLIGFLDDFIKFKFKRNLGLKPYQKIPSLSLSFRNLKFSSTYLTFPSFSKIICTKYSKCTYLCIFSYG